MKVLEGELDAGTIVIVSLDITAIHLDDPLGYREAEARVGALPSLEERRKDSFQVVLGDSRAVVAGLVEVSPCVVSAEVLDGDGRFG